MTFREKLAQEHPEEVSEGFVGGCYNCPTLYGYEETRSEGLCHGKNGNETICRACWDREMPLTPEEREQHDLEINEEIIQGYCHRQDQESCRLCPAFMVCGRGKGTWRANSQDPECPTSAEKQRAMLDAFESAFPLEEEDVPVGAPHEIPQAVRELVEGRIKELTEQVKALEAERDALCDWLNER